jgi:antitoxin component YwqK of YwqJK toxin-antitoxin module
MKLEDFNIDFESYFMIKNGKAKESVVLKDNLPLKLTLNENSSYTMLYYTEKPQCYNEFVYLTEDEKNNNKLRSIINLNTNNFSLEKYELLSKPNGDLFIEGQYRLFKPVGKLFDTTFLWAEYHYENGLKNGVARIWDAEKNGKENIAPMIVQNYMNDYLDGEANHYYSDGTLAVNANFNMGNYNN